MTKKEIESFIDDREKMRDFINLSKENFLKSYSYLTEEEYEKTKDDVKKELEYIRKQIRKECISYGEIAELQSLSKFIDKEDVELLEWAGVEEFGEERQRLESNK